MVTGDKKLREVLAFLSAHQPLASDDELDAATLERLDEARRYCLAHPSQQAIPLWLGVFGAGDGGGIYPLIEDVLAVCDHKHVVAHLKRALRSASPHVRYWSAQIAARFPSSELLGALEAVLKEGDLDTRDATITALEAEHSAEAIAVLRRWLPRETDADLKRLIREVTGTAE